MAALIGRDGELRIVDGVLDELDARSSVLVIRGEAGIGKSTILAEVAERSGARGFACFGVRTAAAEASLTLTTLSDLLETMGGAVSNADLPEPQRRALDAALLVDADHAAPMQPRVLGAALRSILGEIASQGPVVVAIDDAQWADPPSALVIDYAVRRLADRPVCLVLAQRSGEPLPFDARNLTPANRLHYLDVGPLTVAALHHVLLEATGHAPARSLLIRIHEASRGNPLFALEIERLLDSTTVPPAGRPLPVPADVRALLRDRIATLPASSRDMLLHAAALGRAPVDLLERALGRSIAEDAGTAEAADVAWVEARSIVFRHPLLAGVIYGDATPEQRRRAHARLAQVVDGVEERARHRALGTDGPSAAVADDLEAAARQALNRGAPAAAADLLRLALEATPPADDVVGLRRAVTLAGYLKRAGDAAGVVRTLQGVIAAAGPGAIRAEARLSLAALRYETDEATIAVELAEAAIDDAAGEPALLARAHAVAAAVDWVDYRRRTRHTSEASRQLAGLADPDPEVEGIVLMQRLQSNQDAGLPIDPAIVERALYAERRAPAVNVADRFSAALGPLLKYQDDLDGARTWIERTIQTAIDEGDEGSLPYAYSHLVEVELWGGSWIRAEEVARRHLELSIELELGAQRRQAIYNLGLVLAHRGAFDEAQTLIDTGLREAATDDDVWTRSSLIPILGFIELSRRDLVGAAAHFRAAAALRDDIGQQSPRRYDADLVEALVGLGDVAGARAVISAMDRRAEVSGRRPAALALASRAHAIVLAAEGNLEAARATVADAVLQAAELPFVFDRARTLLVAGQIERRRRERRAARALLDDALEIFVRLGSPAWSERARQEVARLGIRQAPDDLTETERRVAELAGSGLTNREVAASLFISAKTVEANLARVYSKLGIRARSQLARALAEHPSGGVPQT